MRKISKKFKINK